MGNRSGAAEIEVVPDTGWADTGNEACGNWSGLDGPIDPEDGSVLVGEVGIVRAGGDERDMG